MREATDMENLFSQHNFVMTTAELTVAKLYYADIQKLLDEGLVEKVKRGYYRVKKLYSNYFHLLVY